MTSLAALKVLTGARVLFVNQVLEMGGAERQALYLARYLKEEIGCEVHFWGLSLPGLAAERCREWGIQWRIVPVEWRAGPARFAYGARTFLAECRKLQPAVILPYTNPANVVCGLTWQFTGADVCIWNQRDSGAQRFHWPVERLAVRSTRFFVSNSVAGSVFLRKNLGVRDGLIRVVRNGIPLPSEVPGRAEERRVLGIPHDSLVACMVANLHDGKDHETLIKAWSMVRVSTEARGRNSILLIVGRDYGKLSKLVRLAADFGLSSLHVRFVGQVADPARIFRVADLCVQSTKNEGTPNAVLEAMSLGLPVVATDLPSMRETLGEELGSCLAAPGDVEALADRISIFLLDDELRHRVGQENKRRVRRLFSLDSMCTNMLNLIVSAVQERRIVSTSESSDGGKHLAST